MKLVGIYVCLFVVLLLGSCKEDIPDPDTMSTSGRLPVLYINTEGGEPITGKEKEDYLHADWWLDNMGDRNYEPIGSPDAPMGMLIKGRGNSTWERFDKKSYRLKLDTKQPLMGMQPNRHYCLLAHADDQLAKLKNTVGFELSRRIGLAYTPAQEPVEVVLNGQYQGLYFITEKPRVGKHRIAITEQADGETDALNVTGGWLLELNGFDGPMLYVQEHADEPRQWSDMICFESVSPGVLSTIQRKYMTDYLTATNAAIHVRDKRSREWEQYIDIDTLAMYYIVGEIMDDLEYFAGSVFVYKNRGRDTKLIFGPVWDFGNAFQRWGIYGDTRFNKFIYEPPAFFYNRWIGEIAKFPHFQEVVRWHWNRFYQSGLNGLDLDAYINDFTSRIGPAFQADGKRWPQYRYNDMKQGRDNFKKFIHRKIEWLNHQWGE